MTARCILSGLLQFCLLNAPGYKSGFNRYYPPDYDPQNHATLNAVHGKHALGDRARKIDQGILITLVASQYLAMKLSKLYAVALRVRALEELPFHWLIPTQCLLISGVVDAMPI